MAEGDITFSNHFKAGLLGGVYDLDTDTIKVALTNGYTFNPDNNHGYNDITGTQIAVSGYTAGGATLTGLTITTNDGGDYGKWDAGDVTWSSLATTTIDGAQIYDDTVTTPVKPLIANVAISTNSNGSNYTISWNAGGIAQLS